MKHKSGMSLLMPHILILNWSKTFLLTVPEGPSPP